MATTRDLSTAEAREDPGETAPEEPQATQGGRAASGPEEYEALALDLESFIAGPGAEANPYHLEPLSEAAEGLRAIAAWQRQAEAPRQREIAEKEADLAMLRLQAEGMAIRRAAKSSGIPWHDLDVAIQQVDLSSVAVDSEGTVTGLQEQMEALAKAKPFLVNSTTGRESLNLPPIREPDTPRRRSIASSGASVTVSESMTGGALDLMDSLTRARFERRRARLLKQARGGSSEALVKLKRMREAFGDQL